MIKYKTFEEIELIRDSALIVSKTLALVGKQIKPGITTLELDKMAEEFIRNHGGEPGFLGYQGFPNSLCISVNEQVVHGIPNKKPLKEGDVVSIDCGVKKNGYFGDHAYTFTVGEVSKRTRKLIDVTKECLYLGIDQAVSGNRIGDICFAVQQHAEKHGFGVVRELVGHGLGQNMHEDPQVPNFGKKGTGSLIKDGMVLAIEPMINMGKAKIKQLSDGWTVVTADRKPSAHFEHNIAVRNGKPEILSTFDFIEKDLPFE